MSGVLPFATRRHAAIDCGTSSIKMLLVESGWRGVRVLEQRTIGLREEGLLSPDEIHQHLQNVAKEWGGPPVALNLPQHLSIAQVIDLPDLPKREVRRAVEEETLQLSGLSDSSVCFDHVPLKPFGRYRNPHWVIIARESDVQQQINRVAGADAEVAEITTTANALLSAFLETQPDADRAVLVDFGANSTVVVVVHQGQGVFSASFPIGSEAFTEAIASLFNCSFEEAETIKRSRNLFSGDRRTESFCAVVDGWFRDLERILLEWIDANPEIKNDFPSFEIFFSGGGSRQAGLIHYLNSSERFTFHHWLKPIGGGKGLSPDEFAVCYGIALESFDKGPQPISLLPAPMKTRREHLLQTARLNAVCLASVALLGLFLAAAMVQAFGQMRQKNALKSKAEIALALARESDALELRRQQEYERIWPVLNRHKQTVDALHTLEVLQRARAGKEFWFVLLADPLSYFSGSTLPLLPGDPALTNGPVIPQPLKNGFITELCIPATGDENLNIMTELLAALRSEPAFQNVDSVPANQRRTLVDPKVLLADRHYALAIELVPSEFPQPSALRRTGSRAAAEAPQREASVKTGKEMP
jgi:Tfp pilus assembly PilM family ATPase